MKLSWAIILFFTVLLHGQEGLNKNEVDARIVPAQKNMDQIVAEIRQGLAARNESLVYSSGHCPCGWTLFGTHCYRYFDNPTTWSEANATCVAEGGHLASINSEEENNFIHQLSYCTQEDFWIGSHDDDADRHWRWTDNSEWTFAAWARVEHTGNWWEQNCGHMFAVDGTLGGRSYSGGEWHIVMCSLTYNFVCQQPVESRPTPTMCPIPLKCGAPQPSLLTTIMSPSPSTTPPITSPPTASPTVEYITNFTVQPQTPSLPTPTAGVDVIIGGPHQEHNITPTGTPTGTPSDTPTGTLTGTSTGTPTCTPSDTPTDTLTATPTGTPTDTPTGTPTPTQKESPTHSTKADTDTTTTTTNNNTSPQVCNIEYSRLCALRVDYECSNKRKAVLTYDQQLFTSVDLKNTNFQDGMFTAPTSGNFAVNFWTKGFTGVKSGQLKSHGRIQLVEVGRKRPHIGTLFSTGRWLEQYN